ncbi:ribosomal silencing factor during starvation domain containing protein [Nitzschia inconspicua]|uniref:Ribosomal silencing factor during starvation domain containing protein n=1 Tax=Nitzschia inconspicua TaxID=303405 RepID=A0A9K3PWL2_9STRA|nr:ribosomal silencing factor during starvation domain containing protein [Nitzschia inconspicua]
MTLDRRSSSSIPLMLLSSSSLLHTPAGPTRVPSSLHALQMLPTLAFRSSSSDRHGRWCISRPMTTTLQQKSHQPLLFTVGMVRSFSSTRNIAISSSSTDTTTSSISSTSKDAENEPSDKEERTNTISDNGDDNNSVEQQQQEVEEKEEMMMINTDWIPPPRRGFQDVSNATTTYPYHTESAQQEHQRLYKQQERIDALYQQQEDALLQLSEDELETMSEEEILKRVEEVLAKEEALEEESFYQELQREEKGRQQQQQQQQQKEQETDWLRTRRAALGMQSPQQDSDKTTTVLPIIPHQLLTADDIQTLLKGHGGSNVTVIMDDPEYPRMGGAHGMVICTAGSSGGNDDNDNDIIGTTATGNVNPFVINTLTRILIDHLKERKLYEVGVVGAQMGTNHLTPRGTANTHRSRQSTWHVVDCGNYIVHIMDAYTRNYLKLEDLWSGRDPLWKLEYWNEDAVEEYCQKHPVPPLYNGGNGSSGVEGSESATTYWDPSLVRRLERNQYSSPFPRHRPVVSNATKRKDRRVGRQKRREQRQQQHRQQQQQGQY